MARSNSGESVLSRMVRIFEAIDPDTPAVTVTELARRADLPTATTWRLVNELVEYGWLHRDGRRIQVGVRMWELAARASPTLGLREAAMPHMEDLHSLVGHHTQLSVLEHREVLSIERLSARVAVPNLSRLGGRLPLHASAAGLVLLANASAALQESVLAGQMRAFTPNTITEPRTLRALLSDIRQRGYAFCAGFIDEESVAVAAPVRDRHGRVAAALSVIVPNDSSARRVVPAVAAAALGISQSLELARRPASAA